MKFILHPHRKFVHILYNDSIKKTDTLYFHSLKHKTIVSLPFILKTQGISLEENSNTSKSEKLIFQPNDNYVLGFMFSNRFATLVLNTGISFKQKGYSEKGKTRKHIDLNFNFYGKKIVTDTYYLNYEGFYIKNSNAFPNYKLVTGQNFMLLPNAKLYAFGLSSSYIFNYKKFSFRGSFTFTEIQKKSAGSGIVGLFYTYLNLSNTQTLTPSLIQSNFKDLATTNAIRFQSMGINTGYGYSLVLKKHFILTGSIINGIGIDFTDQKLLNQISIKQKAAFIDKLNTRFAIRYDKTKYFIGLFFVNENLINYSTNNLLIDYNNRKFLVFAGIRLDTEKAERRFLKKIRLLPA